MVLTSAVVVAATSLTGCAEFFTWGSKLAPTPSAHPWSPSPSATPTPTPSPSASVVTTSAKGSMLLYANLVSKKFTGTCAAGDQITITLADHANDFYGTVDITVVIDPNTLGVVSMRSVFGPDSEEITRELVFDQAAPVTGTSASLIGSGPDYKVTGTAQALEDRHGKQSTRLIPYTITANCTS